MGSVVGAMSAGVVPNVVVASDAAPLRLALPSLSLGESGSVALTGFNGNKPIRLEITSSCKGVANALKEGEIIGIATPDQDVSMMRPFSLRHMKT